MNELIQYLKGYQAWRRGQDERTMSDAGINPVELGQMLDLAIETLEALPSNSPIIADNLSDDFDLSLGAAINSAAGSLPEGYVLKLEIENGGYSCRLITPSGVADVDRETIVDEIEALVEIAIDNKKRFS